MDPIITALASIKTGNWLTLGLLAITAYYAIQTRRTVRAMEDQNDRLVRPYVTVRLTRDRTSYILLVENTGRTPAEDLRLDLSQEFYCLGDSDFALSDETLFSEGVGTFPPGSEVGYVLGDTVQMQSDADFEQMPRQFAVTARYSYHDTDVEETFDINLRQFAKEILVYKGARRELKELRETLEDELKATRKTLEKLSSSMEGSDSPEE